MILQLDQVNKIYKNGRGIKNISFTLQPGEVLGLLGPNGAGKTTVMKSIASLVPITTGSIRICGINPLASATAFESAMAHMGFLVESPALLPHVSVLTNLTLAAKFYPHVTPHRVQEVLEIVHMAPYQHDNPLTLSLGMRQRVAIALAILSTPTLLVLDEPSNGLDIDGMVLVRHVVNASANQGAGVIVSSHLAAEIQQMATKIALINQGHMIDMQNTVDILKKYQSVEAYFLAHTQKGEHHGHI